MGTRSVDVDDELWEHVQFAAAEAGVPEDQLVAEALWRFVAARASGLRAAALLDMIADRQGPDALSDDDAMTIAIEEIQAARAERRARSA